MTRKLSSVDHKKLASLHSTCMAMLTVNGWILHLIFTPCSSVPLLSVGLYLHLTLCLSPLLTTPFIHMYPLYGLSLKVKVCALAACSPPGSVSLYSISGQNGLPPTPNTLHFGCSYCLHPSHPFLSTWGAVMLDHENKKFTDPFSNNPCFELPRGEMLLHDQVFALHASDYHTAGNFHRDDQKCFSKNCSQI